MVAAYPDLLPEVTGLPSPVGIELQSGVKPLLRFARDVRTDLEDDRWTTDLADVAREPETLGKGRAMPVYTVYRNVQSFGTLSEEVERHGLCYTLLAMRGGTLLTTPEYGRTRGHTNSVAPGTHIPYPEIHEVLTGDAWLYLQQGATNSPADTVVMPLHSGDKAVVAPGWASVLVNIGEKPLIVGTWRMADCQTEHDALVALGGMAHYILRSDTGKPFCEANEHYKTVPVPRHVVPREFPDFGLTTGEPLLTDRKSVV